MLKLKNPHWSENQGVFTIEAAAMHTISSGLDEEAGTIERLQAQVAALVELVARVIEVTGATRALPLFVEASEEEVKYLPVTRWHNSRLPRR